MPFSRPHIILIDGHSGAGKTTLANLMADRLRATVVHLDDSYPGWGGLAAGRDSVIADVLTPFADGRRGMFRRWNWVTNEPAERVEVEPTNIVIIEGCGISTPNSRAIADVSIWLETDEQARRERLHLRDGDEFAEHIAEWERQVTDHIRDNDPDGSATVIVRS